jgi:DASS family divalent anion:Na+ symporter
MSPGAGSGVTQATVAGDQGGKSKPNGRVKNGIIVVAVAVIMWFLPVPHGLTVGAWRLFGIFLATLLGLILQPLPLGAMAFLGLTVCALAKLLTAQQAVAGFGSTTIWLIVSAFLFARGFLKTGLGRRVAYLMMRKLGDSTLKLAYALAFSDLIMSPAMPSATARVGGVLFPITRGLCSGFQSEPGATARRMGTYLMQAVYQCDNIVCAMFLTSMAANPMVAAFAQKTVGVEITWQMWALATSIPGLLTILGIPYLLFKLSPPELKNTPEAKGIADTELARLGPMSRAEKLVASVFFGCLILWCTGSWTKVDPTVVAMMGVVAMVLTGVLDWKDILEEKGAWDTMVWMGSLMTLADGLVRIGFIPWFAKSVSGGLVGIPWVWALLILILVYFYAHYAFASMTVHTTAMYVPFLSVAAAAGGPRLLVALSLGFLAPLSGGLTHFAGAGAPIYFGAGYVSQTEWWRNGFIVAILNLVVFVGVGAIWWKIIGLW